MSAELRRLEARFWAAESKWADKGSGMTPDQQTGAHMAFQWLASIEAPAAPVDGDEMGHTRYTDFPEAAPALDVPRLERAIQTVTAQRRLDIIENEENGDMASVVTPPEFARLLIAAYATEDT